MTLSVRVLCIAAACAAAAPALAQEDSETAPARQPGGGITVAGGAAIVPDYEGSEDYRVVPMAAARGTVGGIAFSTQGLRLYVDLVPSPDGGWDVQLGPVAGLNLNRASKVDDPRVAALGRRKVALEVGGYAGIARTGVITSDYDRLGVSVTWVHDVTGIHDSYVVTPSVAYGTPLSRTVFVGIAASADYAGGGYADAYFSVTPAGAAASGLPAFNARKGWKNWSLTGLGNVALTGNLTGGLSLVAMGSYKRLTGDFARSPVVSVAGDRNQWMGALGLAYTF